MATKDVLWAEGHDETVEVNQRALIDKVLARYSGEFTVFRELLQNSDDASARAVEIRFETEGFLARQKMATEGDGVEGTGSVGDGGSKQKLPDLKTEQVHQWTFKNNGIVFRDEDWNRLKKIAEGNPDEEKIGAFGVGFYSLFSVTEEPWVTSGGHWMGFYWKDKKDQLFARRGSLPAQEGAHPDPWTTFQMILREPAPIPPAFDFTRFLVSSMTFMAHLSEVSVYFDDRRLVRITKDGGKPKDIPEIEGLKPTSPKGIMTVKSIQTTPIDIQADVVRWVYEVGSEKPQQNKAVKSTAQQSSSGGFFSSLFSSFGSSTPQRVLTPQLPLPTPEADLMEVSSSSVRLTIFSANVEVKLDKKLSTELLRSTKKNPPSKLKYELIYTGKPEYDASVKEEEKGRFATGSVFQGLRADLDGSGAARIFIGHSTGQTSGIGGHMATRFIPTVERESIDLVDRHVAVWNKELLYVGGFLSRSGYEREMAIIREKWNQSAATDGPGGKPDPEIQGWLRDQALHAMKFYTFHASTPSSLVSAEMEQAFFACAQNRPFPIMSTEGIRDARTVRSSNPTFAAFLKRLATLPDEVATGAPVMIAALRRQRMILDIVFDDVLSELQARPLEEPEAVGCLKWWAAQHKQGRAPPAERARLLDAMIVSLGGNVVALSTIRMFLNAKKTGAIIPTDGPLPNHLLPVALSRYFDPDVLATTFPWQEFGIFDWLQHILDPSVSTRDPAHDVTLSPQWAERMLQVLTRGWPNIPKAQLDEIVGIIKPKACIPTSAGLNVPDQAYFASVNLFRDLPTVTLPSGNLVKKDMEKVLFALGVRKHVELQMVFDRMIKTGDWTIIDLVKYLVSVESTLSSEELQRLKQTSAFTMEDKSVSSARTGGKAPRFKAKDLYEPTEALRELKLPIIDWGTEQRWRPPSDEAKFLFSLGLKRSPPLGDLLKLAAGPDAEVRPKALKYFIDNSTKYTSYDPYDFKDLAFVPAIGKMGSHLATPLEVYTSSEWSMLGFAVIAPNWKEHASTKFKIREHPPTARLVSALESSPPPDQAMARKWFEILASRIPEFSNSEQSKLSMLPFVPAKVGAGEKATVKYLRPGECYFAGTSTVEFHSKIFIFVDFGPRANPFLAFCGTKQEPSVEEIVQILLSDPHEFFELTEGRDNYQHELKNIALNRRQISQASLTRMRRAAILLGSRRVRKSKHPKPNDADLDVDEEDWDHEYDLLRPDQVVIADDANSYQLFGDSVYSAPQDDLLEGFYLELGSGRLSRLVKEEYSSSKEIPNATKASSIRHLILERLPLFLHEHSQSRLKVTLSWLQEERNFVVRSFGRLSVTRSLRFGSLLVSRPVEASAVARWDRRVLQLWLATNTEVDMYEVSTSMCRTLFDSPKASEILLFMTILSTDLRSLKRRGYNVDRILRRQKEDAEKASKAAAEERERLLASAEKDRAKGPAVGTRGAELPVSDPSSQQEAAPGAPSQSGDPPLSSPTDASSFPREKSSLPPFSRAPSSNVGNLLKKGTSALQSMRNKIGTKVDGETSRVLLDGGGLRPHHGQSSSWSQPPPSSGGKVTPLSSIDANVQTAIKACSEEKSDVLRTRQQMTTVKETENEGYCDISGRAEALDAIGNIDEMKVYLSPDVPERETFMSVKHDGLLRFINIIHPLCDVFELSKKTVHIFSDQTGPLIAFNRNGSLFVNFRYYEAWRPQPISLGGMLTYFSLAHEIAHNLVQPHNSEHEFYFSYICERCVASSRTLPLVPNSL
ncbi:hypothetical protein K488DRAFT_75577 [Vararia minispora EC-137]|uniref:Uncharacterized protein n=1 Tax=Vararia minispora EC-137 TaxID=1314806 RepID=A0ACB8QZD0_9AGAM|nr:hypothetical protein K488DRAFT_75577 [Vararia minispora EC-137]